MVRRVLLTASAAGVYIEGMSDVLAHLDRLEGRLGQLWPEQVYAFDLACVERQWPIYERSARGRP